MGYTPENNPYIPGDPYSYDMAWMVQEVKKAQQVGVNAQDSASAALQSQIEAQQAKDLAMAWAIGEDDGGPIPPGEPQYENNAKYYAEQAGASAQDAADSAGDAAASADETAELLDPVNQAIAVIEARMDSFTNLAEGSTTGDAELIDARIGADGTTYANAGDAIRTQVSDLGNIISPIMITGYAIYKSDGHIQANAIYDATPFIPVYPGMQIHLHTVSEGSGIGTCWYDSSQNFISAVTASGVDIDETLTPPATAAFIRFISKTGIQPTMRYIGTFRNISEPGYLTASNTLKAIKPYLASIADKNDLIWTDIAINSTTGKETPYATGWKATPFIDLLGYSELYAAIPAFQSANPGGLAFYDSDYTYISGVAGYVYGSSAVSYIKTLITVPAGAKYARFSIRTADENNFTVAGGKYAAKLQQLTACADGMQLFEKIGVIGDSISVGWAKDRNGNNSRRNTKISWPQQMARKLGATAYNLGASGVDPITWFDPAFDGAAYCYSQYLTAPECDLYIIGLGLNGGTLGSVADIDASDYENNAATFYGQYARIIQMINDQHPTSTVICLTQPTTSIPAYDQAVRDICALNYINAILVDIEKDYYSLFNTPEILAERQPDNVHFTPYGYSLISEAMIIAISDYIANNPAQFKYVGVTDI